jgi:hypothetical protein
MLNVSNRQRATSEKSKPKRNVSRAARKKMGGSTEGEMGKDQGRGLGEA